MKYGALALLLLAGCDRVETSAPVVVESREQVGIDRSIAAVEAAEAAAAQSSTQSPRSEEDPA